MTYDTINDAQTMQGSGAGTLLAGRYSVVRQLGQGGMGSVWLVEDAQLDNKQFAVKMLPAILVANKRAYRQLKDEALVAMRLVHPNIVQIRAFEENNGNPFLVMDYVDGQTLDDYLAEKGKLTEDETLRLLKPIAAALDYAHGEGVVHRDVKPANVMIRKDGHPYILDFGIAREIQETMTRVTGKLSSGTLLYMSPEQLHGAMPKKEQDVYSFAAMAYECLKGEPPFSRGQIEYQIDNDMPEPLLVGTRFCTSVMSGLSKKTEGRPPTCATVLEGNISRGGAEGRRTEVRSERVDVSRNESEGHKGRSVGVARVFAVVGAITILLCCGYGLVRWRHSGRIRHEERIKTHPAEPLHNQTENVGHAGTNMVLEHDGKVTPSQFIANHQSAITNHSEIPFNDNSTQAHVLANSKLEQDALVQWRSLENEWQIEVQKSQSRLQELQEIKSSDEKLILSEEQKLEIARLRKRQSEIHERMREIRQRLENATSRNRKVVGILTSLLEYYIESDETNRWTICKEIQKRYSVKSVPVSAEKIDGDIDVLILICANDLPQKTLFAIDQYVLRGGRVIVCVDPLSVMDLLKHRKDAQAYNSNSSPTLDRLFNAWGIAFTSDRLVADSAAATKLNGGEGRVEELNPAFLSFGLENVSRDDVSLKNVRSLMFPFAGGFSFLGGSGITCDGLVFTSSDKSSLVARENAVSGWAAMQTDFKPDGKAKVIVARLYGKFPTAFPAGNDTGHVLSRHEGTSEVVLFGDADFIAQDFCFGRMDGSETLTINDNVLFFMQILDSLCKGKEKGDDGFEYADSPNVSPSASNGMSKTSDNGNRLKGNAQVKWNQLRPESSEVPATSVVSVRQLDSADKANESREHTAMIRAEAKVQQGKVARISDDDGFKARKDSDFTPVEKILQNGEMPPPLLAPPTKRFDDYVVKAGDSLEDYVVKAGDSLGGIAYSHGVTIRVLKKLNDLRSDSLLIGQTLKVPIKAATAEPKVNDGKKLLIKDSGTTFLPNAIMPFVQNGSLPGAIGVLYKNGCQETACMGWANVGKRIPMSMDRTFMICSQSKGFCGVGVALLVEEGKINLDDPVSRYLPQFANMIVEVKDGNSVKSRTAAQNEITIRHLLTHSAGFPFDVPSVLEKGWTSCPISQVVAEAAANPLLAEPGTKIQYSNVGFAIAAAIIEKLSGRRYEEFLEKRIFNPLGMRDTTFRPTDEQLSRQISMYTLSKNTAPVYTPENKRMPLPHNGPNVYAYPAMGLWSTADDLLKFYQMIMLKGVGANGVRLLQEQTVLELLATSQRPPSLQGYYSLGFSILQDEPGWLGHGGAWGTYFKINIDKQELFLWVVQLCGGPRPWDVQREEAARSFFRNVQKRN